MLSVISDKKIGHNNSGTVDYYIAEVLSQNDYYPFGMLQPGRKYEATSSYRYGFNGKENDNEVKGEGNSQDYGMRIYDPRLGKFLSVDPLANHYSSWSPYPFAMNRPIDGIDLDGAEWEWFLVPLLDKFFKGYVGLKPVNEKQLASQTYYQAATTSYKAIKFMLETKTPMLDFYGNKFRSDKYYAMENYINSGMSEGVKSDNVRHETKEFVHKWLDDFSYLATGTYSQAALLNLIGDIFSLKGASDKDKLDAIQGVVDQSRNDWRGISQAGITFGSILLSYGGSSPNLKSLRISLVTTSTQATKGLEQLGFKELQTLTKKYSSELNAFFKSGGSEVASTKALQSYKELATRILNGTRGAPATKLTETALKVQSQRLEMINKALEKIK